MLGQDGNALVVLLVLLAVIFCIFKFVNVAFFLSNKTEEEYLRAVFRWFTLPASLSDLLGRPWSIITYMFIHHGVFHFIGNLLWLWVFGFILQDLTGNNKLIPIFIYGGLAGAFLFILTYNIFPALGGTGHSLEGASAGVMGVAIATTVLAPQYRLFPMFNGGIPLWVLTVIFIIIDFASIPVDNAGGHISHLGGATIGFFFVQQLRHGRDWSTWMNNFFTWCGNLFTPDKKSWKKTARTEFYYNTKGTQPFKKTPNITQKRVDEILDKINLKGYRSLSEEEKEILKRAAKEEDL